MAAFSDEDIKLLFTEGRTHNAWLDKPVDEATLRRIYELASLSPSSANSNPMRVVFVRSPAAKERLKPALSPGNVDKTMAAPATAIVAYDTQFYEQLPRLFPHVDMRSMLITLPPAVIETMATVSGSIQGAFLIAAARALGLDAGPMGGFDKAKVDAEFLAGTTWKSSFLVNLGYGDKSKLLPRLPRLTFEEATRIE